MMDQEPVTLKIRSDKKIEPEEIKEIIRAILAEHLQGKVYDHIYAPDWTKLLTITIHDKIKELELERYKFVVQVTIGEDRGQGLKAIAGCIWDEENDNKISVLFTSETLFCVAVVFLVLCYLYE